MYINIEGKLMLFIESKFFIMGKKRIFLSTALTLTILLILSQGCKKEKETPTQEYLIVSFPKLSLKHDLYFSIAYDARSIEILFNKELDAGTIANCIRFSNRQGSLESQYNTEVKGNILWMKFNTDFELEDGWKYMLSISTSLKSIEGESLRQEETFELRTTTKHITSSINEKERKGRKEHRTLIACISDIHMGDPRAIENQYSWFGKNADALMNFLEFIYKSDDVKEVAILGDLFDEWMVPYTVSPIDPQSGIHNSDDYYKAIANSETSKAIFDKLRTIADFQEIDLLYVPGNHDMLLTQSTLEDIIPGIIWKGDSTRLGKYNPVEGIIMEHGHRYDLFNCPQPLVNPDHILPPGYFISRLYAAGLESNSANVNKEMVSNKGSAEFLTAWSLAILYTLNDFNIDMPDLNASNILMGGIDGYSNPFSFIGAQNMYAANIEDLWSQTQTVNEVPVPLTVFAALLNGVELYDAALIEYMQKSTALNPYKIVAFGHSHNPELIVHPIGKEYTSIYANSGSWIDEDQSSHDVRTFLTVEPGEWSGSELDIVKLYQYNLNSDTTGTKFKPKFISEESIDIAK